MGLSLLLIAAAMGLVPFVGLRWILAVILLWVGFGEGSLDVGGNTLLVWRLGERVGPYMNALHFFFGAGAVMAPLLVNLAAGRGGIQLAYWLIAALIFPIGLAMFFLKSPPRPQARTFQERAAVNWAFILPVVLFFCVYVGAEVGYGGWIYSYALEINGSQELAAFLSQGSSSL